jgi:NCAIR mutase (PurE)-related protein
MKKIYIRSAIILAITLLCTVYCHGQQKKDTVKIVMMVSDTNYSYIFCKIGYEVNEEIETNDWIIDIHTGKGEYQNYIKHLEYLDNKKCPLSKNIIVWQFVYK